MRCERKTASEMSCVTNTTVLRVPCQIRSSSHRIFRALVTDPDVLLMDEPFSSLDEITARKMRRELLRIWQETRKTIVFVTHDISESVFLSQLILIVTQKPCTISSRIEVGIPYPRNYGDDSLFEMEKLTLREFLKMDGNS